MNKFGQVLTPEEVAAVPMPMAPWVEPIKIVSVPTSEEMAVWVPDSSPDKRRFRWEQNVTTGERNAIELTLDEYKARHVAKIITRNEYVVRKTEDARRAARQATLGSLLDKIEADPTILDRIK